MWGTLLSISKMCFIGLVCHHIIHGSLVDVCVITSGLESKEDSGKCVECRRCIDLFCV